MKDISFTNSDRCMLVMLIVEDHSEFLLEALKVYLSKEYSLCDVKLQALLPEVRVGGKN